MTIMCAQPETPFPYSLSSGMNWSAPVVKVATAEEKPKTFIAIDLETTGLVMEKHGIIQIGAWATGENEDHFKDYFVMDVNPHKQSAYAGDPPKRVEVTEEALKVNGFTHERIEDGLPLPTAMRNFLLWMNRWKDDTEVIIVGQNTAFDIAWLKRDFYRLGFDTGIFRRNVDCYTLSFLAYGMPMGLGKVATKLGLSNGAAHDALGDAFTTSKVFHRLTKQLRPPKSKAVTSGYMQGINPQYDSSLGSIYHASSCNGVRTVIDRGNTGDAPPSL